MKFKILNKVVSISLIIIIVSHLTFLHSMLQEYVLCNGADGHIAVENIEESTACLTTSLLEIQTAIGQSIYNTSSCEDISLDENCIEDNEFLHKDQIDINIDLANDWETITPSENDFGSQKYLNKNLLKENYILRSYTTVSLLI